MTSPLCLSRRRSVAALTATAAALITPRLQAAEPPRRVLTSFSILADMAREVAPAELEVTALVGVDADAHVFEPRPHDSRRLAEAGLVVVNGLGFEGWIDRLVKASGYAGPVVVATQGVAPRKAAGGHSHGHSHGHRHDGPDPHAWQDVALAGRYVDNLAAGLSARWPSLAEVIQARALAYRQRLAALDASLRTQFSAVPADRRRVITSHDAFGYFGAAYGVEFLSPRGWVTGSEPSAAAVARLIRQIRDQGVRAVFVENITDTRLMERIAKEGGAQVGGVLYSDALSAPGGPADSYVRMMEHNARTLLRAMAPR